MTDKALARPFTMANGISTIVMMLHRNTCGGIENG
jgi:hypothetical protein